MAQRQIISLVCDICDKDIDTNEAHETFTIRPVQSGPGRPRKGTEIDAHVTCLPAWVGYTAPEPVVRPRFDVVTLSMTTGAHSVTGHAAGCRDIAKALASGKTSHSPEDVGTLVESVESKREAFLNYNADFIAEGGEDNAYDIHWYACAKDVPEN